MEANEMSNRSESLEATAAREELMLGLSTALESDQYFLVYQPEIDLHTNAFAGVEALLRWRHPVQGVVNPDTFVPELEAQGLIVAVGSWAISTACAQGSEWHDKGYRFSVSLNISPLQFEWPAFVDQVEEALHSNRFPASLLVLEFAQSTLTPQHVDQLAALKHLGVRLAIDDFVPGSSQLSDLATSPVDIVKLDRQFIASMSRSDAAAGLVHSLVAAAKGLHLQIVASGIEDDEQRRRLQLEDVAIGQGFHFSKPHEAVEIDRYLEDFSIFSGKPL
jgi:EAL domain-containing protein (putative c-di-GMP-specific phosphodiesterase class I)